ncbi:histidine biosynthesis bifunctional protein hisIE, chloroplastic isoform X1 [Cryptomeria japonica]|uniref:histidine biosynthesis bifunctional protein hisIE, chloroplastic isoform X1 n=1 Tax=Cryptomeria japonica TaxID=3369 RepID=UPI0025AB7E60|nr:histidine biosynthesis bifunctional protein hisIE, chloroplastic isoform X1 [Cryptomeria japonica]
MAAMFTAVSQRSFHATNVRDFAHFNLRNNVNSFKNISYPLNVRRLRQNDCNSNLLVVNATAAPGHTSQGNESNYDDDNENNRYLKTQVEGLLETIKWDEKGLVVAIAQHIDTGAILMQGFANKDAVSRTLMSCKATFYSRSRSSLWTKGETSSNFINIADVFFDCDRDSVIVFELLHLVSLIIYLGKPDGPTCHTGMETCYFTAASDFVKNPNVEVKRQPLTSLYSLEDTIYQRKSDLADLNFRKPSWTKKLLDDQKLLCSKIREEANELCQTLEDNEDKSRTASEMADVLYHSMVLLAIKNVKIEEVLEILRARFSKSGIEEKNSRKGKD